MTRLPAARFGPFRRAVSMPGMMDTILDVGLIAIRSTALAILSGEWFCLGFLAASHPHVWACRARAPMVRRSKRH